VSCGNVTNGTPAASGGGSTDSGGSQAGMATAHGKGKSGKATLQILGKSHAEKHRPASDNVQANSMSPHLSMHSTRGQQAGEARRGRGGGRPSSYWRRAPIIKGGKVYQKVMAFSRWPLYPQLYQSCCSLFFFDDGELTHTHSCCADPVRHASAPAR